MNKLLRCAASSIAGVCLEFVLYSLLVSRAHLHYLAAAWVAGVVYFFANFALNRWWAFGASRRGRVTRHLVRHALVSFGGAVLGTPLLWALVTGLHLPYRIGWAAAGAIAFFSWTFPMHRYFTYRHAGAPVPITAARRCQRIDDARREAPREARAIARRTRVGAR
jgi:putative flippase GtrA